MKKRFTPGPWEAMKCHDQWVIWSHRIKQIVTRLTPGKRLPDAKLIAAAPDLLAALENCIAKLEIVLANYPPYDREAIKTARAAIDKALGNDSE